jgi:hypothetical protein
MPPTDSDQPGRDVSDREARPFVRGENDGSAAAGEKPSLASLIKDLRDESLALMKQEVALLKTEMTEKAKIATRNVAYIAAGGIVALGALICLLAAASYGVAAILYRLGVSADHAVWLGWLIVGAIVGTVAFVLVSKGIKTLRCMSPVPEKTIEALKEDKQWLTNKIANK